MRRARRLVAALAAVGLALLAWSFVPSNLDRSLFRGVIPAAPPDAAGNVAFAILETGRIESREAFVYRGGSFRKPHSSLVAAVIVRHARETFLFDTGFGRDVDLQFQEAPAWGRLMLAYDKGEPTVSQLARHGIAPESIGRIVLSHIHWDHASAIEDFPRAKVCTTAAERRYAREEGPPAVLPSQFDASSVVWEELTFRDVPYEGFPQSYDLFDDGSVVLVPLPGHTPGSLGMFLTLASGRRFLFTGDLTWSARGLDRPAERPWLLRRIVDRDDEAVRRAIVHVHELLRARPRLTAVPAHDGTVLAGLAHLPAWEE